MDNPSNREEVQQKLPPTNQSSLTQMRVLHVIPSIAWRYGGTSTTIRSLCAELAQRANVEVELATTDADGPGRRIALGEVPGTYPVHVFPRTATEQWKYSRSLGSWLRSNVARFDLVHIHALWSFASKAAARAADRAQVPYVVRPAGMLSEYTFAHHPLKKRLYWYLTERKVVDLASAFHATSTVERDEILRIRPDANVHVIPNGVDEGAWTTVSLPNRGVNTGGKIGEVRPVVLFMSRLHSKKGIIDLLLPAMAHIDIDALLIIAGGRDVHEPEHVNRVRQEVNRLGLADKVRLLGPIPADRRWEMYDSADVFVLPSHSENFGIVVAEAMARGCPVLITEQVQACEHVVASGAGVVVSRQVPAFAQALQDLLADDSRRKMMGNAGSEYARKNLRWRQVADQVCRMYQDTTRTSHGSPHTLAIAEVK